MKEDKIQELKRRSNERFWQEAIKAYREGTLTRLSLPENTKPQKLELERKKLPTK